MGKYSGIIKLKIKVDITISSFLFWAHLFIYDWNVRSKANIDSSKSMLNFRFQHGLKPEDGVVQWTVGLSRGRHIMCHASVWLWTPQRFNFTASLPASSPSSALVHWYHIIFCPQGIVVHKPSPHPDRVWAQHLLWGCHSFAIFNIWGRGGVFQSSPMLLGHLALLLLAVCIWCQMVLAHL